METGAIVSLRTESFKIHGRMQTFIHYLSHHLSLGPIQLYKHFYLDKFILKDSVIATFTPTVE